MDKPTFTVDFEDLPAPEPDPERMAIAEKHAFLHTDEVKEKHAFSPANEAHDKRPAQAPQTELERLLAIAVRADAAHKSASEGLAEVLKRIEDTRSAKTAAWAAYADAFKAYHQPDNFPETTVFPAQENVLPGGNHSPRAG